MGERDRQGAREIEAAGGRALPLWANVAVKQDFLDAIDRLQEQWGRLDIVFANAGINRTWAPLEELTDEERDEPFAVN